MEKDTLAIFSSIRCPGDIILKTYDLARALRNMNMTIISGFQSPMEKECLTFLLRGNAPIVICPARGLARMRLAAEWRAPLAEGRLLLLSFFDDKIRRPTAGLAQRRNEYVGALADRILIAHAQPGGKIERICKTALALTKPVFTLDSPANARLVDLGAKPISTLDLLT
ncbi:MAG: hypothetical protein ACREVE_13610 [Gammaproteobacteria bacterium]